MELETFILADAVNAPPDGKFYVLGGGISKFNLTQVPTVFPLGILMRFALDEGEVLTRHRLAIRLFDPDDADMLKGQLQVPIITPDEPMQWAEGEEHFIAIALNLGGIPITREGLFRMEVRLDGDVVHELRLPAVKAVLTPAQKALLHEFKRASSPPGGAQL